MRRLSLDRDALRTAPLVAGDRGRSRRQTAFARHGIGVAVPAGWWASGERMSSGVEPVFRLTLSDRPLRRTARDSGPCYGGIARQIQPDGVVAIVREALGADFKPERFHLRSRHFVLPPRKAGEDNSCLGDHATLVIFRQAGRGFYLWIAAGRRASPAKYRDAAPGARRHDRGHAPMSPAEPEPGPAGLRAHATGTAASSHSANVGPVRMACGPGRTAPDS